MSRSGTYSLLSTHTAGMTDISTAKIISLPDLSQAGQECVIGTACISILTHGSHSSTQAHVNTHRHMQVYTTLASHRYHRGMSTEENNEHRQQNQYFPTHRY